MKTAKEWAIALTDKWSVGNRTDGDWDSATNEELEDFIKQIQLDVHASYIEF